MNNIKPSNNNSIMLKSNVEIGKPFEFDRAGFPALLKSLSPFQTFAETIAQITYYKHQIRMLDVEQTRIEEEAKIKHHQIDAALSAGLRTLEERRMAFEASLGLVAKKLEHSHIEKNRIIDSIQLLTKNIANQQVSIEDKRISMEAISYLTESLKTIGEQSIISLELIAKSTLKALDTSPRGDKFKNLLRGE